MISFYAKASKDRKQTMKTYYPTIGLEIHAELATDSKMFCSCKNDSDETRPNVNTCPICMAHPGTLPVPNEKAIESVVKVGLAIGADIANFSEFDRKNYFYPDIPKGYQISQYKYPIVAGGTLGGVDITRIHLEEDTANSKHSTSLAKGSELRRASDQGEFSLVDYNRAGVPLMELVTEPVIHDAETAVNFAKELQLLLRTLGVSHANIEKGEMRIEVNVSVSEDPNVLATKVEVKNIGSITAAGKAISYEIERMTGLHEAGRGDEIVQETRGWDENKQSTFSQRKKENSHDYRYFPDPDIPKFYLHEMFPGVINGSMRENLPELPGEKRDRYKKIWNHYFETKTTYDFINGEYEKIIEIFIENKQMSNFLDESISYLNLTNSDIVNHPRLQEIAKVLINDVTNILRGDGQEFPYLLTPELLVGSLLMKERLQLNNRQLNLLLVNACLNGMSPEETFAIEPVLFQIQTTENIRELAQEIIDANPAIAAEYRAGKEASLMFFVGQMMKATKGSGNPAMIQEVLKELLT